MSEQASDPRPFFQPRAGQDSLNVAYLLWKLSEQLAIAPTGCWEWFGAKSSGGYGQFRFGGRTIYVHRLVYEFCLGDLPRYAVVCHQCDNPPCCNPAHLFIGTQGDNVRDAYAKGRLTPPPSKRGSNANAAKLTESQVVEIRQRAASANNGDLKVIAAEFGIDYSTLRRIVLRQTWRHIP